MNNFKKFIIAIFGAVALASCGNETDVEEPAIDTDDPIARMIEDFRSYVNPGSRAGEGIRILSVDTKYYHVDGDTVVEATPTRADEDIEDIFDITTVRLSNGETEGFAVLSTDKRINKVFYYTEDGEYTDSIPVEPLADYISNIPNFAGITIGKPTQPLDSLVIHDLALSVGPIVPFKWGQGYPFNKYATECDCSDCSKPYYSGHNPIGCVAVATAQAIATIGSFKGTYYANKDIDFKNLPIIGSYPSSSKQMQLAQFLHEVALCCQIKFECEGSGSNIKAAYHYLKDIGYTCSYVEGEVDVTQLYNELRKGYPHLIAARRFGGGHMWIVDGLRKNSSGTYFSCNWGWDGDYDGWVEGSPYIAIKPTGELYHYYQLSHRQIYIQSKPS